MVIKVEERKRAIELRVKGESINAIAKKVNVSKSTVSLWCKDISLSPAQVKNLRERMVVGGLKGRLMGARANHDKRIERYERAKAQGIEGVGHLSDKDIMIAFAALYWGEGSKKRREFAIVNSDPEMIRFAMGCIRQLWKIEGSRFAPSIMINSVHMDRETEVKSYWSKVTKIPEDQFRKTTFLKVKNKKVYENFLVHYGTLTIKIKKSIDIYYKVMGLIEGLIKGAKG